jgi:hypothetical protein
VHQRSCSSQLLLMASWHCAGINNNNIKKKHVISKVWKLAHVSACGNVCGCCSASSGFYQVAIKFFLKQHDFHTESQLYTVPAIAKLLPPLKLACSNNDVAVRTASGYAYPPFLVTERGAPLTEVRRLVLKAALRQFDWCGSLLCMNLASVLATSSVASHCPARHCSTCAMLLLSACTNAGHYSGDACCRCSGFSRRAPQWRCCLWSATSPTSCKACTQQASATAT